jgi:hypothetical protein
MLAVIGRQHGIHGECAELVNCPSCGSTICVVREQAPASIQAPAPQRPRA